MKTLLSALAAVALVSSAASAAEASKTKEDWTPGHAPRRISGTASHHSAAVRPAAAITGGQGFAAPRFDASNHSSFGGSLASAQGGTVRPLRAMPRSRTSGAGVFVEGLVQGRGYATESAAPAKANAGGGTAIVAGKGRALSGPGLTKGDADVPPGGAAAGSDPLSIIASSIGNLFGDIAKAMTALWGG